VSWRTEVLTPLEDRGLVDVVTGRGVVLTYEGETVADELLSSVKEKASRKSVESTRPMGTEYAADFPEDERALLMLRAMGQPVSNERLRCRVQCSSKARWRTEVLAGLEQRGLIDVARGRGVSLTDEGEAAADKLEARSARR
jgi:ribosomal protein S19E (S16A)